MSQSKHEIWLERVTAYRNSGMTQKSWCQANGVNYNTFRTYAGKFSRLRNNLEISAIDTEEPCQWASVKIAQSSSVTSGVSLEVGDVKILLDPGFDEAFLIKVIRSLTSLC